MNINFAIREGAKILKSKLIQNPSLDSEILMAETIKKNRKYILLNPNKYLEQKQLTHFQKLIENRSLGKPIAYLTNKKFFWNSEFIVTSDTLIPRPDTEVIIENILRLTRNKKYEYSRYRNWFRMYSFVNFKRETKLLARV